MTTSGEHAAVRGGEAGPAQPVQYLTFTLGSEVYALEIENVREVLDFPVVTRMPAMPRFLRGVIDLRGSVVPVIDLRLSFGMPETERKVDTCVIITDVTIDGVRLVLGALADSVREVIDLDPGSIAPAPKIGTALPTEFITGIARQDGRFITILNIERVFGRPEHAVADAAA
jgi:purine-binding chemotaxis protein CheW